MQALAFESLSLYSSLNFGIINSKGELSETKNFAAGQSSSTNGYTSGGSPDSPLGEIIDKFPFSSNGNATDVGDLTQGGFGSTGQSSTESGYNSGRLGFPGPFASNVRPTTRVRLPATGTINGFMFC